MGYMPSGSLKSRLFALLLVGTVAGMALLVGSMASLNQPAGAGVVEDNDDSPNINTINDTVGNSALTINAAAVNDTAIIDADTAVDDAADADTGPADRIYFTKTTTSTQDPGLGHEDHQMSFVLPPNAGTIYDGSMTFTSNQPVQVLVLHEISKQDAKGQHIWTIDGETIYALSLFDSQQQNKPQRSGSVEFTGAALGLHSTSTTRFVATVSVDGSVWGQPGNMTIREMVAEQKEPQSLLSRTSVPVTIPMHEGLHDGEQALYIITDGSDERYTETLSKRQDWKVEYSPVLANVSDSIPQKLFVFKNGIKGGGIHGFQDDVFSSTPSQEEAYTALGTVIEVTWKPGQRQTVLESAGDVNEAQEAGRIKFDETGIILNTPQVVWPDGQMMVRSDKEIEGDDVATYGGGQVIEIDKGNLTATFMAHRGWGPDGSTTYHIITDATPQKPAATMGVVSSPILAGLIDSPAASDLFYFKNGIRGSGQLGFQPGISSAAPGDDDYTPIWKVYLVEWNDTESARILETKSDIDSFRSDEMLSVSIAKPLNDNYIVNSPHVDPFQ